MTDSRRAEAVRAAPLLSDLRDAICFVERHEHPESYCNEGRAQAHRIREALIARHQYRAERYDLPDVGPGDATVTVPHYGDVDLAVPRFDHDGTFRHHHDVDTAEPVWWGNCEQFGGEKREHRHHHSWRDAIKAADESRSPRTDPFIEEDHSEIEVVPDAQRNVWLTEEEKRQPGIPDFSRVESRSPRTEAEPDEDALLGLLSDNGWHRHRPGPRAKLVPLIRDLFTAAEYHADIVQAGLGGPDFTPKEWPEAEAAAPRSGEGLDAALTEVLDVLHILRRYEHSNMVDAVEAEARIKERLARLRENTNA